MDKNDLILWALVVVHLALVALLVRYFKRYVKELDKNIQLQDKLISEMKDCNFWMRVVEEMERSGGVSRLLNNRRSGQMIVKDMLYGRKEE
mgnify:CR=1 FL=1